MTKDQYQQDLHSIRQLMERSVKVSSLSGLAGILAGCYALIGAGLIYRLLPSSYADYLASNPSLRYSDLSLAAIPLAVLVASLATVWYMTSRRAATLQVSLWNETTRRWLVNFSVPLAAGGIFILIVLAQGPLALAAPACMLFYGIALVTASDNMFDEFRYLGYSEIVVGLVAAVWTEYGLILWAVGLGLLHLVYGAVMYKKYER